MSDLPSQDASPVPTIELPIFPLSTVLFPSGVLPLKVFEARYMDMVRDCLKNSTRFGVCLITDGGEVGQPALHMASGCEASITDWDMEQLGLLNIRTIGQQRFEIETSKRQSSGLIVGKIRFVDAEPDAQIPPDYSTCVDLLRRIVRDLVEKETDSMRKMIEQPYQFDSSSWVSNRLCEFLPISGPAKQKLMMLDDPIARLGVVYDFLKKQDVI